MVTFVASGGSTRGVLHVGAYRAIRERGIKIDKVYGTSAGSLIAGAIACGKGPDELEQMVMDMDFSDLVKGSYLVKFVSMFFMGGMVRGRELEKFLYNEVCGDKRFKDLDIDLNVVVHSLTEDRWKLLNRDNTPDMLIQKAIRASSSIPVLFDPVKWWSYDENGKKLDYEIWVDGGISKNFPVDIVEEKKFIGHRIYDVGIDLKKRSNVFRLAWASFSQALNGNVKESIADTKDKSGLIVHTRYSKSMLDFKVSVEEKKDMLRIGYENMYKELDRWLGYGSTELSD